jgi:glycerol-3-phosphate dehydrogenase
LLKDSEGLVNGLVFADQETGQKHELPARCVVNATGPFCDELLRSDDPESGPTIAASQGVHIVLDRSFLPGDAAIMVPHTRDGRVMFAIPWHGHVLVGTTETPINQVTLEPKPQDQEIDFILDTASQYLTHQPRRKDILSAFAGIRPLVNASSNNSTAALSREHTISISKSGLLTIAGGKWTTYRKMAEDCLEHATVLARVEERPCVTQHLPIHGAQRPASLSDPLAVYGSDSPGLEELIRKNPDLGQPLHTALPIIGAQVIWAVRNEMARTVEDVLARRTRALFLNVNAAIEMAPKVARLMAAELQKDEPWQETQRREFLGVAANFEVPK